jgi:hypothetical protein
VYRQALLAAALAPLTVGCSRKDQNPSSPTTSASSSPARPAASATTAPAGSASATSAKSAAAPGSAPPEKAAPPAGSAAATGEGRFVFDEIADVGPAAPAAAAPLGVVLITRSDEVLLARLTPPASQGAAKPGKTKIAPIERNASEFAPFIRGPAVLDGYAYWISKTRLVRRRIERGPLEELARAARDGTRVNTARAGDRAGAAYIGQGASDLVARLWIEGHGERELSPEGSAANSVALVAPAPSELLAVALEGRTAMTPIHARRIEIAKDGAPKLADDVVVWVGSSAQALTEVTAVSSSGDVWAFSAIERDITHFGLARLRVGSPPSSNAEASWRDYPNGLDPAPVSAANVCGEPVVIFAQPSESRPHAPQELHLATSSPQALGASQVVARARGFSDVSIAPLEGGALIAYVADRRTWALGMRCKNAPKPSGGRAKPVQNR